MVPVTLYKDIEESTLELCRQVVEKITQRRRLFEREGRRVTAANTGAQPLQSHKPEINVAILDGLLTKGGSRGYSNTVAIYITVVSTASKTETQRRDELYPMLIAITNRLLGAKLKKEGVCLPLSPLEPSQTRWGQSTIDGENGFLSYTLVLETVFSWVRKDGDPDEDNENLPWLEGIDMLFDKMPENEEALQAKVNFSKEV